MQNYTDTIIGQYANSSIITQLLANMNDYIDPLGDYQLFYDACFNIDSAHGYGLDVWGRIVGVTRVVQVPVRPLAFGFDEVGAYTVAGFAESVVDGSGWFADSADTVTEPLSLQDGNFRLLILAKALYNITDGSIPAINQILLNLFPGRGNAFVVDNGGMVMTYQFSFVLTDIEYAIVTQTGSLPKPAGVAAQIAIG